MAYTSAMASTDPAIVNQLLAIGHRLADQPDSHLDYEEAQLVPALVTCDV